VVERIAVRVMTVESRGGGGCGGSRIVGGIGKVGCVGGRASMIMSRCCGVEVQWLKTKGEGTDTDHSSTSTSPRLVTISTFT